LLSNNSKKHVEEIGTKLNVEGIHHAIKPRKKGFFNALKHMNLENNEVAVIGDQIFTDVFGGNRLNMYTILVEQIYIKDIWITKIKRPFEKYVLKKYFNSTVEVKKK
jgi:HAD superfamily phosphatase (TIGR01668 family)